MRVGVTQPPLKPDAPVINTFMGCYLYSMSELVLLLMRFHQYFSCPSISGNLPMTINTAHHQFSRAEDRLLCIAKRTTCKG